MKTELHRSEAIWLLLSNDTHLSAFVSSSDKEVFKRRLRAEGMQFLNVSLPALGKALDRSFETGKFECPEGWRCAKDAVYPAFLNKAFSRIFTSEGRGRWLSADDEVCPLYMPEVQSDMGCAVHCIRQLTTVFYKYETPWTKDQADTVCSNFVAAEGELSALRESLEREGLAELIDGIPLRTYLSRAERLITRLLKGVDPLKDLEPRYGTGATAEKSTPWGRWEPPRFIAKLDAVYSVSEWFFSGLNGLDSAMRDSRLDLVECESPTARVVLVPKDSRGPRLISAEPREYMYLQQAQRVKLEDAVERYPNVKAQVSIIDQSRNRWLACWASMTGSMATLDLKEASDRLSWWLVILLFPSNWVGALNATRSESTIMPDGVEIPLNKFAPMGSAVCFPVEALVFWALANAARSDWSEARFTGLFRQSSTTRRTCEQQGLTDLLPGRRRDATITDVCVFGDDIIVPIDQVDRTVSLLEAVGLKVNRDKSFVKGPFRESCGGDYFYGMCVTPHRVKHRLEGDSISVMFRVKDNFNRLSLLYGDANPSLIDQLQELFKQLFGLEIPVFPSKGDSGTSALILIDYHWCKQKQGSTLKWDKRTKRYQPVKCKLRHRVGNRLKPDYCRREARVLTEIADEASRDLGWCSVLRSFHLSGGRGGTDTYALRRRVHHELAWQAI